MPKQKIKYSACKPDTIRTTLEQLGLDFDGKLKENADKLAVYYTEHDKVIDMAICDVCNAKSDASLDACPFCGEVDDEPLTPPAETKAKPATKPATKSKPETKATKATKVTKATKSKPVTKATKATKSKPATKAKPSKAAKAKPATKKKKSVPKKPPPEVKAPPPEVVAEPVEAEASLITVEELEEQIDIIKQSVTDGAVALHRLGAAAKVISDAGLWRMRKADNGLPMYRNFKQFLSEELGLSSTHVYRAIGVAEEFDEDELSGLSGAQIRVVMQLPKGQRSEVLDAAKGGERGVALSDRAAALSGKKDEAPPPTKAVTVALVPGIKKIPLFKRPKKAGKSYDTENAVPAKSIADDPFGVLDASNNVQMRFRLVKDNKGNLFLSFEPRRGEQTV